MTFSRFVIGAAVLLGTGCRGEAVRTDKPPNIVFVSIDTLRADHVSCYGYGLPTTPNLDRLASRGHRFEQAYTVMPTTLPSHAAMFTSLYPSQLGVRRNGDRLSPEAQTLPEILKSRGYATAAFVSAAVMSARYGLDQGFDVYDGGDNSPSRPGGDAAAAAISWLGREGREPFFLFVHLYDPHTPYHAPAAFRSSFGAPDEPLPPVFEFVPDRAVLDAEVVRSSIRAYDAEIAYADASLGELVSALETRELMPSTLVLVVADHGESLDELLPRFGYAFDHGEFLHAHELRVPIVLRLPTSREPSGAAVHATAVSVLDLMPTLLDLLGIPAQQRQEGRSLRPLLEGRQMEPIALFAERRSFSNPPRPFLTGEAFSVLDWPRHLMVSDGLPPELYDLGTDPRELQSVAPANGIIASRLRDSIHDWRRRLTPLWKPAATEMDPAALERLKSLGYVR